MTLLRSAARTFPLTVSVFLIAIAAGATPTNVILMIGDGMGPAHEQAARLYSGGALAWDAAPFQAQMTTDSLNGTTDSAASASAMATGQKYFNFAISQNFDGTMPQTSLEVAASRGKRTGLVTTSFIEDATPAGFGAHAATRFFYDDITTDYLGSSRPNVLFGGTQPGDPFTGPGIDPARAAAAGYAVATNRAELFAIDPTTTSHVSGQFGTFGNPYEWEQAQGNTTFYDANPFLSEMTSVALSVLNQDPDGFFLMVEQEGTDSSGHNDGSPSSRIGANVFATLEFSNAVQTVLDWIAARPDPTDTLLIVTADHETGGLQITNDNGPGNLPTVTWAGTSHTSTLVNAYGWGPNASAITGVIDNTDLFAVTTVPEPGLAGLLGIGAIAFGARLRRARRTASSSRAPR